MEHSKLPGGYGSVKVSLRAELPSPNSVQIPWLVWHIMCQDVNKVPTSKLDEMQSFVMAETFKYLYLLFSSDKAPFGVARCDCLWRFVRHLTASFQSDCLFVEVT